MSQSDASDPGNLIDPKLPRRDWVLLPLTGLLTIALIVGALEMAARVMFRSAKTTYDSCLIMNDPVAGVRAIPNSVCLDKAPEGELAEYRFDSCGYRGGLKCGPKPRGIYRIVLVGSSGAMGLGVRQEKSFAALLPEELSRQTGRKIELYNEGIIARGGTPRSVANRFNEVLAAQPDMILWILTPWDIDHKEETAGKQGHGPAAPDLLKRLHLDGTGLVILLRHYLYESQSQYVKAYLMGGEDAGLLTATPSATVQDRLRQFDVNTTNITGKAKEAGVPLVAVLVPNRAEAAMISMGQWQDGFDPYMLDNELRSIVTSHGGTYIDILPGIRAIPNADRYYFPVDGHLDNAGNEVISKLLADELVSGAVPSLASATHSQAVAIKEQGR